MKMREAEMIHIPYDIYMTLEQQYSFYSAFHISNISMQVSSIGSLACLIGPFLSVFSKQKLLSPTPASLMPFFILKGKFFL